MMTTFDIIALVVTAIGVISFSIIFTILYRSYAISSVTEYEGGGRDLDLIDEAIFENQPHVKTQKKILNFIKQFFFYLALAVLIPAFGLAIYSKFSTGIAMINGQGIIVVASGSMSEQNKANSYLITNGLNNQFNTYDIITLKKVEEGDLKLYDVIAFVNDEKINVIHRIIGFTEDGRFITRGDSNNADDSYHPTYDDVLGKYTGDRVQYLGVFIVFFQSYSGMITLLAIIYCLIMIDRYTDKVRKTQEARLELLNSAMDFENETECEDLASEMTQKIYFKGFEYTFNEQGFVDKREIDDDFLRQKSEEVLIKEKTLANGEVITEDVEVQSFVENDADKAGSDDA